MGYPTDTGDAAFNPVTRNPRTPQLVDEYGNQTFYGTTDNTSTTLPTSSRDVDFFQYGVYNGSFGIGPPDPNHDITDVNPLPDWTGPVSVSGGAITAQWVASSVGGSGNALQLTLNAGAASDEVYFEQIVPIGGSLNNFMGHAVMVSYVPGLVAGSMTLEVQYLTVAGATVGSATTVNSGSFLSAPSALVTGLRALIGGVSNTARSLRIRVHYLRDAAAASATDTVTVADVRMSAVPHWFMLREYGAAGDVPTTPTTPPSGFHTIYPKTDHKLYSKGSGGTEYLLSLTAGSDYIAAPLTGDVTTSASAATIAAGAVSLAKMASLAANSIIGNNTGAGATPLALTATQVRTLLALVIGTNVQAWDADLDTLAASTVAKSTFTPALAYATVGSSTWATTTATGFYTQLLDRVIFNGVYQGVPTNGTAAGNLQFTGLPVTSNATASSGAAITVAMQGWTKASYTQITGIIAASSTTMLFRANGSGQANSNLVVADIPTGGTVIVQFSGMYFI